MSTQAPIVEKTESSKEIYGWKAMCSDDRTRILEVCSPKNQAFLYTLMFRTDQYNPDRRVLFVRHMVDTNLLFVGLMPLDIGVLTHSVWHSAYKEDDLPFSVASWALNIISQEKPAPDGYTINISV